MNDRHKPPRSNFGAPTKYKPEYCQKLKDHMARGFSFLSFAAEVGVHTDTIYEWQKQHVDFSEAIKQGDVLSRRALEAIMVGNATGKIKGNPACAIFLLKNRFPREWKDRQEISVEVIPQVSDERLKELAQEAIKFLGSGNVIDIVPETISTKA